MKLKQSEVASYREDLWKKQRRICPLCGTRILKKDAVLDHCHESGHIRGVLHRQCNQIEGRVLQWVSRSGKNITPDELLKRMLDYWASDHSEHPLHPTHLTPKEKEIKSLRKRMRKVKRESTKKKYQQRIKELQRE